MLILIIDFIDILFFENIDVLFRVILSLLTYHKDNLLACDGMEQIMNYIKSDFPIVNKEVIDKIIKQVFKFVYKSLPTLIYNFYFC